MQLKHTNFQFTLLTPCFSGTALGKQDDQAEMRLPPIRGHVRCWHRALFGPADCNRVWGSTSGNEGHGSRVSLRFVGSVSTTHASPKPTMLPHKTQPGQRGPRPALAAREAFTLSLQRLVGCTPDDWDHAQRAVKLWLLVGGLGLRSNRAAGSVWPEAWPGNPPPQTDEALKTTLQEFGLHQWSVALIGLNAGKSEDELRETASDTIAGQATANIFGSSNPRRPSPTRFKVIRLGQACCLLAVAPPVRGADGGQRPMLQEAERLLLAKPNPTRWRDLGPWNHLLP